MHRRRSHQVSGATMSRPTLSGVWAAFALGLTAAATVLRLDQLSSSSL